MESEQDLLNLSTTLGYIGGAKRSLAARNRSITAYLSKINDHHYDNIDRLGWIIQDYDSRISLLVKGANARARIRIIEAQKEPYLRQRRKLKEGWKGIALTLQEESRKLFALPRELREKIYGYLYVKSTEDEPLAFSWPDTDVRGSMLPHDPYLYLNAHIVDPQLAAEAAQILYNINVFQISTISQATLTRFIRTDHYASGITPRDVMRRVHLSQFIQPCISQVSHEEFEDNEQYLLRTSMGFDIYRVSIAALLEMKDLRVVDLHLTNKMRCSAFEFRTFSPTVKILKERGVVVRVKSVVTEDFDSLYSRDLSELFNEPSVEDLVEVQKLGPLDFDQSGDDFDQSGDYFDQFEDDYDQDMDHYSTTGQIPAMADVGTVAQWKTYLHEHYQVFKERNIKGEEHRG